jgi:branched-chain amino acid transport system substrate-binding protein
MSKKYLILGALIAVSLVLAGCGAGASAPEVCAENPDETVCAVIEPGSTIKVGYAGPITGEYSAFGTDISQAAALAVDDANEAGGLEGFEFELVAEDTGAAGGEEGAAVANLLSSDPDVVAIAGHTFSGSTAAAIPIYNEARIPMLSPSATRADLTEGDQDVFHRIPFTDDLQGQFAAEYLFNVLGVTRLAVMHDGQAYGVGLAEKVQAVFTELGGEVVAFEAITPSETDYSAALTDIGAADPEAIFFGGYYTECAVIAQGMPVAGMEDVILFSDDGTYGATFIELAGEYAEGVYAGYGAVLESEAKAAFDAHYEEVYGSAPGVISTFTWHGYDVADALIQQIKSVAILGGDGNLYIPREALIDAVNTMTGYEGLTGTLSCNGGECNASGPSFQVVQDGVWVIP